MKSEKEYSVQIFYREPSYELRSGSKEKPYSGTYQIRAKSEDQAIEEAVRLFRTKERNSHVGWNRFIEKIVVSTKDGV
jgi:hypothetical protein